MEMEAPVCHFPMCRHVAHVCVFSLFFSFTNSIANSRTFYWLVNDFGDACSNVPKKNKTHTCQFNNILHCDKATGIYTVSNEHWYRIVFYRIVSETKRILKKYFIFQRKSPRGGIVKGCYCCYCSKESLVRGRAASTWERVEQLLQGHAPEGASDWRNVYKFSRAFWP